MSLRCHLSHSACSWRRFALSTDVMMPQMGESIAEGTIVRWIKRVGDPIDKDEPLFEISTDKVDAEIPSPGAGVLLEIKVKEGETVPVNSVVRVIGGAARSPRPARRLRSAAPPVRQASTRRLTASAAPPPDAGPSEPMAARTSEPGGCARRAVRAADAGRSSPSAIVAGRPQDREGARHRHHRTERHRAFPAA